MTVSKSGAVVLSTIAAGLVFGVVGASAAPAAVSNNTSASSSPGDWYERTELYFGTAKPDGTEVTPEEFDIFVDKEVTPAFPSGLTVLTGKGQWRGESGEIVKEKSYVLILFYPANDNAASAEIEEIREDYQQFFEQEAVLRTDTMQRVSF